MLSVVVFVHEFGHFQVARWRGVAIDTFSIGFGKTLLGWRDKQGVQWKVGALPLGGYVKFADDADAMSTGAAREDRRPRGARRSARARASSTRNRLSTRSMVVAAGPITNFIFAIFAFALLALDRRPRHRRCHTIPARIASTATTAPQRAPACSQATSSPRSTGTRSTNFSELQRDRRASPDTPLALESRAAATLVSVHRHADSRRERRAAAPGHSRRTVTHRLTQSASIERIGRRGGRQSAPATRGHIVAQTGSYIGGVFTGRESGNQIAGPLGIINVSGQVATSGA